ncbi:DUF2690 domain-containing protein [Streptomyces sp. KLOTTS4A1]|uniref:DUF2690 domain-containing protein n=1 Tax=Streptomyces sp. KLOTTS4A1 TaxID=3390996 RepID=UPI0039F55351
MPRWRALPEELDPQVREFASQLRRLVDRSGLSIAAVSDRTGYSKTSWERYLNGRLLAPKGAIVALAEVTGTNPMHLTTMWELAERAWSRSEMRHDMTMEAIRISQARAALGEFGPNPPRDGTGKPRTGSPSASTAHPPTQPASTYPPRTSAPSADQGSYGPPSGPGRPRGGAPSGGSPDGPPRRGRLTMLLAGLVGAAVVIAAVFFLTDFGKGDDGDPDAGKSPTAPATTAPELPEGVECHGDSCTGQDPETMGCGGAFATTAREVTVGPAKVEVRYSKACGAAWARITAASPGDKVEIRADGETARTAEADADFNAYTTMLPAASPDSVKACATLLDGKKGCTK